jgi:hypothetical protein
MNTNRTAWPMVKLKQLVEQEARHGGNEGVLDQLTDILERLAKAAANVPVYPFPPPNISRDPDGTVDFSWIDKERDRVLVIAYYLPNDVDEGGITALTVDGNKAMMSQMVSHACDDDENLVQLLEWIHS